MFKSLLRYLGLDAETKKARLEAHQNMEYAKEQLDTLQRRFDEASFTAAMGKQELNRTLSDLGDSHGRTAT